MRSRTYMSMVDRQSSAINNYRFIRYILLQKKLNGITFIKGIEGVLCLFYAHDAFAS